MSLNQSPQLLSGGNILPSTFVKLSTTADNTGLQAGANDPIIGISQVGTDSPPGVAGATAYAAVAGEQLQIYGLGDICSLLAGSGGFTSGDRLKSDATGGGVTIATSGVIQNVGAVALETTAASALGRVQIGIWSQVVTGASGSIVSTDITGTASTFPIAGLASTQGGSVSVTGGASSTSANAGGAVTIAGGAPGLTGNGGAVNITGAVAGATSGTGGAVVAAAGAGGAGSSIGAGGAISSTGGASTGSGAGGQASLVGGAGGLVSTGGAALVTGGAGGATSGSGGAVTITGGAGVGTSGVGGVSGMTGGAGIGASAGGVGKVVGGLGGVTGAGGAAQLTGGAGGATSGTGGAATIAAGAGTGTSAAGGAASIKGGASPGASGTAGSVAVDAGAAAGGTGATILIGDVNAIGTYINRGPLVPPFIGLGKVALGTVQSSTPTSAQLLGGIITQSGTVGGGTVTLPTGTALSTACSRTPVTGDSFTCNFASITGGQTLTLTGATGTAMVGTVAVSAGKNAMMLFLCTGANTWDVYSNVSA